MLNQTEHPAGAMGWHFPEPYWGNLCLIKVSQKRFHRAKISPSSASAFLHRGPLLIVFAFSSPGSCRRCPTSSTLPSLGVILLQHLGAVPVGNKSSCVAPVGGTTWGHLALQNGLFSEQHRETGSAVRSGSEMAPGTEHRAGGCPCPQRHRRGAVVLSILSSTCHTQFPSLPCLHDGLSLGFPLSHQF